jgi:predicted metal-dependent HD superfamily phosphohydrolase
LEELSLLPIKMLKETFTTLIGNYTNDTRLTDRAWNEIEADYSQRNRHYHTLEHLHKVLNELLGVKEQIEEWDTVLFTLFYHDIIYNTLKNNNEENSASLAERRLRSLSVPAKTIDRCKEQILATKKHSLSENGDTNYFTDADLAILGQDWTIYSVYAKNVRREYFIYPDLVYNPGRKRVLLSFLSMERIFKTDHFYIKYERIAKQNLEKEMVQLK